MKLFVDSKSAAQLSALSFVVCMLSEMYPTMPKYNTYLALFFLYLTVASRDDDENENEDMESQQQRRSKKTIEKGSFLRRFLVILGISVVVDLDWLVSMEKPISLSVDPETFMELTTVVYIAPNSISTIASIALVCNLFLKVHRRPSETVRTITKARSEATSNIASSLRSSIFSVSSYS